MSESDDPAPARKLRSKVRSLRRSIRSMETEVTRTRAVLACLSPRQGRSSTTSTAGPGAALDAFERWLATRRDVPEDYLADAIAGHDTGAGLADGLADLADGQDPPSDLPDRFEGAYAEDREALTALFEEIQASAQTRLETLVGELNNAYDAEGHLEDEGVLQAFVSEQGGDLQRLGDHPVALLPVRLETRFVGPNDSAPEHATRIKPPGPTSLDATEPEDHELRVRVYPDAVHVDTHDPALTRQEELWGRTFWAKLWLACHEAPEGAEASVSIDEDKLPDAVRERGVVQDLATRIHKFSADASARYEEIKERAWNQLVERFGHQRAAWVVHTLAPGDHGEGMLAGPEEEGPVPWGPDAAPELSFPTVPRRHASWTRPPRARLLPDRWIAVGYWRPREDEDAQTKVAHVTGSAIREPLAVGPGPQLVSNGEDGAGDHPPGLAWMQDFEAAEQAGMALRFTADDLDGHDPSEAVFERLIVLGVKASMQGDETTRALRDLLEAHHYTDGLELLQRGTATNNTSDGAGYRRHEDPTETLAVECGPGRASFGDLSDGDLLARALGVAAPEDTGLGHVFSHIEGAGRRRQATARHMNSLLWPGTIGYHLTNLMTPNTWTGLPSIWEGVAGGPGLDAGSTPYSVDAPGMDLPSSADLEGSVAGDETADEGEGDQQAPDASGSPLAGLGEALKTVDAFRRHFVRYVRAGGPFPPLRVGRHPYGVLPVAPLPGADVHDLDLETADDPSPVNVGSRPRFRPPSASDGIDLQNVQGPVAPSVPDAPKTSSSGSEPGTDRTGYSLAVSEDSAAITEDLYGSSYDPAVPSASEGASIPSQIDHQKALRTDHLFPDRLAGWLSSLAPSWEAGASSLPTVQQPAPDQDPLDAILERRAVSEIYEEERLQGSHARVLRTLLQPHITVQDPLAAVFPSLSSDTDAEDGGLEELEEDNQHLENGAWNLRVLLQESTLDELDPRMAWMSPLPGGSSNLGDETPFPLTGSHPGKYLSLLHRSRPAVLDRYGDEMSLDAVPVARPKASELFPDAPIEAFTDAELALFALQADPDDEAYWGAPPGERGQGNVRHVLPTDALDQSRLGDEPLGKSADRKYADVKSSNGLALQSSLFRQVTRFSTLQAYRQARLRLGVKWGEPVEGTSQPGLLSPRADGGKQSAIPDPSVHVTPPGTQDPLQDQPPETSPYAGYSYEEILFGTCADLEASDPSLEALADEPPADPRLREVLDSLGYLEEAFADDLELARSALTETLDLASHRLDAWWTSLATRRLFTHREFSELRSYDEGDHGLAGEAYRSDAAEHAIEEARQALGHARGTLAASPSDQRHPTAALSRQGETTQESKARKRKHERAKDPDTPKGHGTGVEGPSAGTGGETATGLPGSTAPTGGSSTAFTSQRAADLARVVEGQGRIQENLASAEAGNETEPEEGPPVTYVGGYGFVEDLDPKAPADVEDHTGKQAEFVHAPSPQHALTAAMLRSSHKQAQRGGEDDRAEMLEVDLSPGRVQAAKHVLQAVRQGQMLADVLGYRFERRLLERTSWYLEKGDPEAGEDFNLARYKFPLRRAFPGVEGQLEHVDPDEWESTDEGLDEEAAQSDVLDGYKLVKAWREHRDPDADEATLEAITAFLEAVEPENGETLLTDASDEERTELGHLLTELEAIVDAVRDLLIAESVHQIAKGNPERAGGGLDDLAEGQAVDDPEIAQTPRQDTGIAHRALVLLGDPADAEPSRAWNPGTELIPDPARSDRGGGRGAEAPVLQARGRAEPALEAWAGELLADPSEVTCAAAYRWDRERDVHTGTFSTPTRPGRLLVDELGFRPDVVMVSLVHGIGEEAPSAGGPEGFSQGVAWFSPGGDVEERALTVAVGEEATCQAREDASVLLQAPGDTDPSLLGHLLPREEGFEVEVTTSQLPDGYPESLVVQYKAFALGDATNVDVGVFTAGDETIELDVDADHVLLQAASTQAGSAAAGVSFGAIAGSEGELRQHAVATSVDPVDGARASAVRDDRCLHLVHPDGDQAVEVASAEATGLGEGLELDHHVDGGTLRGLFVALETPERVPAPVVGLIDPADAEKGHLAEEVGFEPGSIELLAAVPVSTEGDARTGPVGGLVQGFATGPVHQVSLAHVGNTEDGVTRGAAARGKALVLPDPTQQEENVPASVRLDRFTASGFELTIRTDQAPLIAYRAWPANPQEITHRVDTSLSLDELDLCALDAVYLAKGTDEASASALRDLMTYRLLRDRGEKVPEHAERIPDDASLEFAYDRPAPEADEAASPITVAAFLEAASTLRVLVQDARALEGKDLTHPGEREGARYTDATVEQLDDRVRTAREGLARTKTLLEARLAHLDRETPPPVTEQVQRLRRRWETFREQVPVDGGTTVASGIFETLDETPSALVEEIERVAEHLPAGPLDPSLDPSVTTAFEAALSGDDTLTVRSGRTTAHPLPEATLEASVEHGQGETVIVHAWGQSPEGWIERTVEASVDEDGHVAAPVDLAGVRPGTRLTVTVETEDPATPLYLGTCRLVPLPRNQSVDAGPGQTVRLRTGEADASLQVEIEPLEASQPLLEETVTTDEAGWAEVSVDLVDGNGDPMDPWTVLRVEATHEGATVLETHRWIKPNPRRVLEEGTLLPGLLWLDQREETFDPRHPDPETPGTPAQALHESVSSLAWSEVHAERSAMGQVHEATDPARPSSADLDAVDALLTDGSDPQHGLEGLQLDSLARALDGVLAPVRAMGLDALFDVTGRPDRAPGARCWFLERQAEDEDRQTQLFHLVRRPQGALGKAASAPGDPSFGTFVLQEGPDKMLREEDPKRFLAYLEPFLDRLPQLLEEAHVWQILDTPHAFVRQLQQLVHAPHEIPENADLGEFKNNLQRLAHTKLLEEVSFAHEIIDEANQPPPFHTLNELYEADEEYPSEGDAISDFRVLLDAFRTQLLDDYLSFVDERAPSRQEARNAFTEGTQSALRRWARFMEAQAAHVRAPQDHPRFDRALRRGSLETVRRGLHRAAYYGVHASTPRSAAGGSPRDERVLVGQARQALERIQRRLDEMGARAPPAERPDPEASVQAHVAQLEALFGEGFQVLAPFQPVNAHELRSTLDDETLTDGHPLAGETWLQRVARVRERPARMRRALSYAEALTGRLHRDLTVGQLPHDPEDAWVGLEGAAEPGRLSLVVQRGEGALEEADDIVAGLFVDEIVENVPDPQQRTAVALNYDDPDTEPPHSILLAMPPRGETWSVGALRHTVLDTLKLAKLRMVDLSDLARANQDLPGALFPLLCFPHTEEPSPPTPSLDFDLLREIGRTSASIRTKTAKARMDTFVPQLVGEQGAWAPMHDLFPYQLEGDDR